jgi:hypothetical protein
MTINRLLRQKLIGLEGLGHNIQSGEKKTCQPRIS